MTKAKALQIPEERIAEKIYLIRGHRVMLDRDIAVLYNVATKALKQAVKRNIDRFPEDFMFQLSKEEFEDWRSQFVAANSSDIMGLRYPPFVFTELGVVMLSSVLKSEQAVEASIHVARTFVRLRKILSLDSEVHSKIQDIERSQREQGESLDQLAQVISNLLSPSLPNRKKLGFRNE